MLPRGRWRSDSRRPVSSPQRATEHHVSRRVIREVAELRALRPAPSDRVRNKEIDRLDPICRRFLAATSFAVLTTRGADGLPDISPRGDRPGFLRVLDDRTLALPDRAGNNRLDSFANLISDPGCALLAMIPGHGEVLRIAGRGSVVVDPELAAGFDGPRPPDLVLLIEVEQAFLHCARAITRSGVWSPDRWPDRAGVPTLAEAMVAHGRLEQSAEEIAEIFAANDARILGAEQDDDME
jgi:hypothetical protein